MKEKVIVLLAVIALISGCISNFTELGDVPNDYSGQQGKFVRVNNDANALVFGNPDSNITVDVNNINELDVNTLIVRQDANVWGQLDINGNTIGQGYGIFRDGAYFGKGNNLGTLPGSQGEFVGFVENLSDTDWSSLIRVGPSLDTNLVSASKDIITLGARFAQGYQCYDVDSSGIETYGTCTINDVNKQHCIEMDVNQGNVNGEVKRKMVLDIQSINDKHTNYRSRRNNSKKQRNLLMG